MLTILLALVVTQAPSLAAPSLAAPAPNVVVERTTVDLLAFSDDGRQALALETTTAATTVRQTFLLIGSGGVGERLPFSFRTAGLLKDNIDAAECTRVGERLAAMAKDLRGITVTIGLCSRSDRKIVDVMSKPSPQVLSQKIGAFHAKVGFAGRTFLAPTGPLVVVIGPDALGNDRVGVTATDSLRGP